MPKSKYVILERQKYIRSLTGHSDRINSIRFDAKSEIIASAGDDKNMDAIGMLKLVRLPER